MGNLDKLHISKCSIEVVGDETYTFLLDRLEVIPDWDVKEWESASKKINQEIGDTRLFFKLDWGYFESAIGATQIGHMALIKKFLDLEEVYLIPDASQSSDKFRVLMDFPELKEIARINKGTIQKGVQIPLKTESRLTSSQIQFFNFI